MEIKVKENTDWEKYGRKVGSEKLAETDEERKKGTWFMGCGSVSFTIQNICFADGLFQHQYSPITGFSIPHTVIPEM